MIWFRYRDIKKWKCIKTYFLSLAKCTSFSSLFDITKHDFIQFILIDVKLHYFQTFILSISYFKEPPLLEIGNAAIQESRWNFLFLRKTRFTRLSTRSHYKYCIYRVPQLKLYFFRTLLFHLSNNFLMFKTRFHILQTWKFYDISSFFALSKVLFHKLVFFKKRNFFLIFFSKIFFAPFNS